VKEAGPLSIISFCQRRRFNRCRCRLRGPSHCRLQARLHCKRGIALPSTHSPTACRELGTSRGYRDCLAGIRSSKSRTRAPGSPPQPCRPHPPLGIQANSFKPRRTGGGRGKRPAAGWKRPAAHNGGNAEHLWVAMCPSSGSSSSASGLLSSSSSLSPSAASPATAASAESRTSGKGGSQPRARLHP